MKRFSILVCGFLITTAVIFFPIRYVFPLDKIKFPYSPIGWESLTWWVAKDAGLFEKYGLEVDLLFQGASSEIIQSMLAGEANMAGLAGPAVIANVLKGGDVIQVAALVKTFIRSESRENLKRSKETPFDMPSISIQICPMKLPAGKKPCRIRNGTPLVKPVSLRNFMISASWP